MKEDNKRRRKKICRFCADSELIIDYKNQQLLENYVTERAKIVPGRVSGACAFHQRKLTLAIKRARHIALLPYALAEM
ncbi:MAG: 30S ribosomal protein S18 [Deltaproteobacteria bacterium]|nr:30S ribosomal protein S18 [Deltaproteobacteria bacterium]MBI3018123.1 30S ribosomal protein S18 [Deltaproteobacteria bacterium]